MAMKDCFGQGMEFWVPVKPGISNAEKQKECYDCEDFDMCTKAHMVHSYRHIAEMVLFQVQSGAKKKKK